MTEPTHETRPASSIHLLPEHLIDQIKAGEVIERPASLIKEILENSLDAGATKIDLHIVANGMDLISLTDNGKGMTFEDLPYAFCRHATSKISRFEDLYKLHSYGFRGEALASIGAVARVTLTSAPQDNSPLGGKILFHGGECLAHDQQDNLPKGTSLYIKDLFYNTPARLKFIKSTQSEKNAIKRIVEAYLLAHPHVSFSVKWDDGDKEFYPQTESFKERVKQVLCFKTKNKELFEIDANYEGHRVWGFFSHYSSRGNAHKKQYLFANKRIFTDKQIHQTVIRNMERLYPLGESGHYCLFLEVPENLIDVNVHPSKTQIKFFKLPVITALISSELKKLSQNSDIPSSPPQFNFQEQSSASAAPAWQSASQTQSPIETSPYWNDLTGDNPHNFNDRPNETFESLAPRTGLSGYINPCHDLVAITYKDEPHLLSQKRLLKEVFQTITEGLSENHQENNFIPLLISEPLSYPVNDDKSEKKLLADLESFGFLCERLDEQTLALRATHKALDLLKSPAAVALTLMKNSSLEELSAEIRLEQLEKIIHQEKLNINKFIIPVDSSFYSRNFNE